MKIKTLISASLLLAFAGCTCGQSGRPNFFTRLGNRFHPASNVGEPCDAGCQGAPAQPAAGGCDSCATNTRNFGGYEGPIVDSYEGTTIGLPPGSFTTPSPTYSTPYPAVGQPSGSRMSTESILPKSPS